MHRIFQFSLLTLFFIVFGCAPTFVEKLVTKQGEVLQLDGARFEVPAGSVSDSTLVRVAKKGVGKRVYDNGFFQLGESYVIEPETLVFQNPIHFSYPTKDRNLCFGVQIGRGFVPLANSEVIGDTLRAQLWHGGEYFLIQKPSRYGIIGKANTVEGLLLVTDMYVGDYVENFKKALRAKGYDFPVWTYVYKYGESIEANARLLHEELQKLHDEYGDFRLDVVSFGIGGLVTHRYLTDPTYYQQDISSAVVAIGTPFSGSNFADLGNALKGRSPFRFFFIDGMGSNAKMLVPGSEFIAQIFEKKKLPGFHYYHDHTENKNFVSLRGHKVIDGSYAEEISGDGLVSTSSAMLTPIEPAVFELDHFELMEHGSVHEVAADFVMLYRSYSWPMLFSALWNGRESQAKINETWEREVKLDLRDDTDYDVLIEYNTNMLNSAPMNAVLITNGDYDTYPAWYLQEKGIREDIIIVNRSLFNLKDYARYLKRIGLPLEISDDKLDNIQHKKEKGSVITISDQLMQFLFKQEKRPVVFSTTVYRPESYGYPLKLSGLVYEISESHIDVTRTRKLLFDDFKFERLLSRPIDSLDVNLRSMITNYSAIAFRLASVLEDSGEYQEALEVLEFARRFTEDATFYYNEAKIYLKIGAKDRAIQMLDDLVRLESGDIKLIKEVAGMYYENGMPERAVGLLALLLRDNPDDKELTSLISKYQGE